MQYCPFNSRDNIYKSISGAVAAGETLQLRLLLHNALKCEQAFLRYRRDDLEDFTEIKLESEGEMGENEIFSCEISFETGLYWYAFRIITADGECFVNRSEGGEGVIERDEGSRWQQTVYSPEYKTPDWLKGGIIYQIFPDRFYNSGEKKSDVPEDRFICSSWSRQPEYRQPIDGKLTLGNDYYGGDLRGIEEKLPYIASLGVNCIYLNPIFEAHSNHRYNTADYLKIDPLLGNEGDLKRLCAEAKKYDIHIILDGVFSHTGSDSRYFNSENRYDDVGAANSEDSDYYSWFKFDHYPDNYKAWWGIKTLPETNEEDEGFSEFITGENGVLRKWLRAGVSGWRLDVADELPDGFLDKTRAAIKAENAEFYLLGEVWEDASNKISYGSRRRFLLGAQLDSVMNYPFAGEILNFVRGGAASAIDSCVCSVLENYPLCSVDVLMNHIGTHDTIRPLTLLAKGYCEGKDREWQSHQVLSKTEYDEAKSRLRLAAALQYTLPGVPSVFYGDEAGVQGFGDPFCRATYPWGQEDNELIEFYRLLGKMRRECSCLKSGEYNTVSAEGCLFAFERRAENGGLLVAVNSSNEPAEFEIPFDIKPKKVYFGEEISGDTVHLAPLSFVVISF